MRAGLEGDPPGPTPVDEPQLSGDTAPDGTVSEPADSLSVLRWSSTPNGALLLLFLVVLYWALQRFFRQVTAPVIVNVYTQSSGALSRSMEWFRKSYQREPAARLAPGPAEDKNLAMALELERLRSDNLRLQASMEATSSRRPQSRTRRKTSRRLDFDPALHYRLTHGFRRRRARARSTR